MDEDKKTANSGFTVNPARTGASQPEDGGIAPPSAVSVSAADRNRRRFGGVKLPGYFDMVNITSFLSAVFFFLLVLLYPETSRDFVVNRDLFLKSIFTLAVFDAVYLTFSIRLAGTQLFFATYLKNIIINLSGGSFHKLQTRVMFNFVDHSSNFISFVSEVPYI